MSSPYDYPSHTPGAPRPEPRVRLHPDELVALSKRLPRPVVTADTTELQAGYQLGVQQVLELLREGWTIGPS